jgi:MFS family permease
VSGPAVVLVGVAVFAGAARGVLTLLQATAISDRGGSRHYGQLSGVLAARGMAATAVAPWAGAALAETLGGYTPVFALLAVVAALAALLSAGTVPSPHRIEPDGSVRTDDAERVR